jgi:hypothetical protein
MHLVWYESTYYDFGLTELCLLLNLFVTFVGCIPINFNNGQYKGSGNKALVEPISLMKAMVGIVPMGGRVNLLLNLFDVNY